jgi:hypothetical protein
MILRWNLQFYKICVLPLYTVIVRTNCSVLINKNVLRVADNTFPVVT